MYFIVLYIHILHAWYIYFKYFSGFILVNKENTDVSKYKS